MVICMMALFTMAFVGVIVWFIATSPLVLHVPDGEQPLSYWYQWKEKKWYKKLDKLEWFLVAIAIGMFISISIGVIIASRAGAVAQ
jgi:hypothetical protein